MFSCAVRFKAHVPMRIVALLLLRMQRCGSFPKRFLTTDGYQYRCVLDSLSDPGALFASCLSMKWPEELLDLFMRFSMIKSRLALPSHYLFVLHACSCSRSPSVVHIVLFNFFFKSNSVCYFIIRLLFS